LTPDLSSTLAAPIVLAVLAVAALMLCDSQRYRPGRYIFKPMAAAAFIWAALAVDAASFSYGQWMLAGLCLCFVGDILLMADAEPAFIGGLGAFLLGHLCYAVAFTQLAWTPATLLVSALPVAALVYFTLRWLSPHTEGPLRFAVPLYTAVIAGMLLAAGMTVNEPAAALIIFGAIGFAISDLAVARQQFIKDSRLNGLWGTPLYFASQMLLAGSVAIQGAQL
jgi:uncharacterized membrane protein YhhN